MSALDAVTTLPKIGALCTLLEYNRFSVGTSFLVFPFLSIQVSVIFHVGEKQCRVSL